MASLPVKVQLQIIGNDIVSNDLYVKDCSIIAKEEKEFYGLINTDGYLPLSVSKLGQITTIVVGSTSAKIKVTTSAPSIIEIPVSGKMFWEIPKALADIITGIDVATDSTTAVTAEVSVWGIAPTV